MKNTISDTLTDIDGNIYKTIKIGTQIWTAENLNVDHFRNGDRILELKTNEEWTKANWEKIPACCYQENDLENGEKYGRLYNWYAVNDLRGLSPEGWHVPTDNEWNELILFLGGANNAGDRMKSINEWGEKDNGDNSSGFSALPGGTRSDGGTFLSKEDTSFWSSTGTDFGFGSWCRSIYSGRSNVGRHCLGQNSGHYVRFVKDY